MPIVPYTTFMSGIDDVREFTCLKPSPKMGEMPFRIFHWKPIPYVVCFQSTLPTLVPSIALMSTMPPLGYLKRLYPMPPPRILHWLCPLFVQKDRRFPCVVPDMQLFIHFANY